MFTRGYSLGFPAFHRYLQDDAKHRDLRWAGDENRGGWAGIPETTLGGEVRGRRLYPLVNFHIAIENHNFSWENQLFLWPFSIAMFVYQRVSMGLLP
jgi:hypothetical protein